MMIRREWLKRMAALSAVAPAAMVVGTAHAAFPDRPVNLVAPFPAGGSADAYARIIANGLSEELRQPVVVQNRPGAGGAMGIQSVLRSAPDGYNLSLAAMGAMVLMPLTARKPPFDSLKDMTLLGQVTATPVVLVAGSNLKARTVAELIADAKSRPGAVTVASTGVGGGTHVLAEMFQQATGTKMLHVPYQGGAQVMQALIGGTVDIFFGEIPALLPQIRAGKLHPLLTASAQRLKWLPEVPTAAEAGVPQALLSGEYGLVGPPGMPAEVASAIEKALLKTLGRQDVLDKLDQNFGIPTPRSADAYRAHLQSEIQRWRPVIQANNISTD